MMKQIRWPSFAMLLIVALIAACDDDDESHVSDVSGNTASDSNLLSRSMTNDAAYIPPQCYTRTVNANGESHNPCFTCHQDGIAPNFLSDVDLQLEYSFAEYARENHWTNLFEDRNAAIADMDDLTIDSYVGRSNYLDNEGRLVLAEKLASVPTYWDFDGDGTWGGYYPDVWFNFDDKGFDHTPDGEATGWRAFAYAPFPGTFWPTNGSTDDVLIRLAQPFRVNEAGQYDEEIYRINLALTEAMIHRKNVHIDAVDETRLNVDLDKDGALGIASDIVYDWAPLEGRDMAWAGLARQQQLDGEQPMAAGLFPRGTEFLHTVRYIDTRNGNIRMAPRLKELRYARKTGWRNYGQLEAQVAAEEKEKHDFPDRLRTLWGDMEHGLSNNQGWIYQGFIEDADGELRPQTYEETVFCMGCHGGMGATTDGVFAFPRKLDHTSFQAGWYHWTQKSIVGQPEPKRADGRYEYTHYLEVNGAGDEFRTNEEVIARFYDTDGSLQEDMVARLHDDISLLLFPSVERARALNKAYRLIVQDQDYVEGRDAILSPPENVHQSVDDGEPTGVKEILHGPYHVP